jgi:hypothetical protein
MRKVVPERPDAKLEFAKVLILRLEPVSHLGSLND